MLSPKKKNWLDVCVGENDLSVHSVNIQFNILFSLVLKFVRKIIGSTQVQKRHLIKTYWSERTCTDWYRPKPIFRHRKKKFFLEKIIFFEKNKFFHKILIEKKVLRQLVTPVLKIRWINKFVKNNFEAFIFLL